MNILFYICMIAHYTFLSSLLDVRHQFLIIFLGGTFQFILYWENIPYIEQLSAQSWNHNSNCILNIEIHWLYVETFDNGILFSAGKIITASFYAFFPSTISEPKKIFYLITENLGLNKVFFFFTKTVVGKFGTYGKMIKLFQVW